MNNKDEAILYEKNINYDYVTAPNGGDLYHTLSIKKKMYKSSHFVHIDDELNQIAETIANKFKDELAIYSIKATQEQLEYIRELTRVFFGVHRNQNITIIPAPCGFGKSVGKRVILKYVQKLIELGSTNGVIVVADMKDDLYELQNYLGNKYCYILEGYSPEICTNKNFNESTYNMCKNCNKTNCKVRKQNKECKDYPVLLMTNARLGELGESVDKYYEWNGGLRTKLIIDERPVIDATITINKTILNNIDSYLNNKVDYKGNDDDKTNLCNLFMELSNKIYDFMRTNRTKYTRKHIAIKNTEELTSNDELFHELWDKYELNFIYGKQLNTIENILKNGCIYINEGTTEFLTIPKTKNLNYSYKKFTTFILDGSSLIDPWYNAMENYADYLYIKNTRTFENLEIIIHHKHNLSKTNFTNKNTGSKLVKSCNRYLNNLPSNEKYYVVTYKDQCNNIKINKKNKSNFIFDSVETIVTNKETKKKEFVNVEVPFHFGATKGKNLMSNSNHMIQLGYNRPPDYITSINLLAIKNKDNSIISNSDEEISNIISDVVKRCDRDINTLQVSSQADKNASMDLNNSSIFGRVQYRFGLPALNEFEWINLACELYQEINRTAIRKQDYTGKITVELFKPPSPVVIELLGLLFPKCTIIDNYDPLPEFELENALNRKSPKGENELTAFQKIWGYLNSLPAGNEIKTKDIYTGAGVTKNQFDKAKRDNPELLDWLTTHTTGRGKFTV